MDLDDEEFNTKFNPFLYKEDSELGDDVDVELDKAWESYIKKHIEIFKEMKEERKKIVKPVVKQRLVEIKKGKFGTKKLINYKKKFIKYNLPITKFITSNLNFIKTS